MIEYQEEHYDEALAGIIPLMVSHWTEAGLYRDKLVFKPDFDRYELMYNNNALVIVTARCEEEIVGYLIAVLDAPLHYSKNRAAIVDSFYILEEHRVEGLSSTISKMLLKAESIVKDRGCDHIVIGAPAYLQKLFNKEGYDKSEATYSKYIGDQ